MFPDWLIEFLDANPYPSLSFLPLQSTQDASKEEISFFYQNEKSELEFLTGTIKLDFSFSREPHAYVMSIRFYPETITTVERDGFSQTQIEMAIQVCETEFSRTNQHHINALKTLTEQDDFALYLYDKKTNFIVPKRINFTTGKKLLKEFMTKAGLA